MLLLLIASLLLFQKGCYGNQYLQFNLLYFGCNSIPIITYKLFSTDSSEPLTTVQYNENSNGNVISIPSSGDIYSTWTSDSSSSRCCWTIDSTVFTKENGGEILTIGLDDLCPQTREYYNCEGELWFCSMDSQILQSSVYSLPIESTDNAFMKCSSRTSSFQCPNQTISSGSPSQSYTSPSQSYTTLFQSYTAPFQSYTSPSQFYTSPSQSYSYTSPSRSYTSPSQSYTSPSQSYNSRSQSYTSPSQSHTSPSQSHTSPSQPHTSLSPSPVSVHYLSSITMSLAAPTVTSIGLIYCPPDGIWYSTLSNSTINGTCYKGTVTASRLCKSNGEWDEIVCHTNRQFNNILNISNMSFTTAIQALLNITATDDDGGITTEQKVILFDTIINNNENQSLEGLEERTELLLALENNIKQELINEDEDTRQSGYGQILLSMDKYALSINRNYTKTSDNIIIKVQRVEDVNQLILAIDNNNGDSLLIPPGAFPSNRNITIASFIYRNLSNILTNNGSSIITPVISTTTNCNDNCNISQPVMISFNTTNNNNNNKNINRSLFSCVYWEFILNEGSLPSGYWSTEGCTTAYNNNIMNCYCNHLTHFAILLSPGVTLPTDSVHVQILNILGNILVPMSLMCILIVIVTYTCTRSLWNIRSYIHVMLCINLFVSQLLFLIGINQTKYKLICTLISIGLQYMFLVTFMWMLMEGVVLYISLIKVFVKHNKRYMIGFTIISYSVPALYMIIMIPIGLLVGTEDHVNYLLYANNELIACWLDYESGFIWSFIIPVIIILLINIGFFAMAIIIMKKHRKNRISNENSLKDDAKYWIKSSISLTIVMGIGWIGNVFFFSEELLFIAYIMTVFISAQGIIIFILYVPLSNNVRKVMWRWCKNNLPRSLMNKLIKDKKATEVLTIIIIITKIIIIQIINNNNNTKIISNLQASEEMTETTRVSVS
ncbi:PREDICTED: adhesion G protein-coupled receptor L3-like [Amphimedon queenslandica]|uniref:G-protein coupled receptors family 2 profile 2 domain-containing protein n=1 Tax=Amphimedon queenslandica TaxID=400682 RepID=A0AAN0JE19_AMPQE|nr:PREDICTED: adhesion G protein-coupled receptor L3-like [Amphimedon queenslandica]|eukprot:XP_019854997.1 PREDICTED: adhesion G protein-coupled receptor L3-like [Amphimedon queenslandica]